MRGVRGSQVTAQGRCLPAGGGDLVETGGQAEYPLGVSGGLTSRGAVCTGHLVGSHLSWCCLHWASRGLSALVVSLHWVRRRLLSMYRLPYSPVTEVPSAPIWPPRDQSSEPAKSLEGRTEPGSCPVQSPRCWRPVSFLSHVEPSKRVAVT